MGSYAVTADVQSEFKNITFSSTTAVKDTEVDDFILQEEATLEGELYNLYITPITGTKSLRIMKKMVVLLVKARILDILPVKTGKSDVDQGGSSADLRDQVMDPENGMLMRLIKKSFVLPDAEPRGSGAGGFSSYTSANDIDLTFLKEVDQW